jgi:hypothetical protein
MRIRQGQDISGALKQPPKPVPLDKFLERNLEELECPVCGANSKHGDFFYAFVDGASLCLGINSVGKSNGKDFVVTYQHVFSGNINGIRCNGCGFNGDTSRFYHFMPRGFYGKVVKIEDEWTTISVKDKKFCVLTENLKRNVQSGDIVQIVGISLEEIEDFEMVNLKDITVQKRGEDNEQQAQGAS